MAAASVVHLVADSGAFIKNANIQAIGDHIYSVAEVVGEIKDKPTRQRLQVLPYDITFRVPPTEDIRFVTEFSKKTGDYPSLSATDIKVLALAYQLEKEHVGTNHIRPAPNKDIQFHTSSKHPENPAEIAGFYMRSSQKSSSRKASESSNQADLPECDQQLQDDQFKSGNRADQHVAAEAKEVVDNETESRTQVGNAQSETETLEKETETDNTNTTENIKSDTIFESVESEGEIIGNLNPKDEINQKFTNMGMEDENDDNILISRKLPSKDGDILGDDMIDDCLLNDSETDDSDDDDDDEGWITPSNITKIKQDLGVIDRDVMSVQVACLTTDFAMQNVLIQMGLNVVAVDGMLIKRAKNYVLRCFACRRITTDMTKQFCFNCGNKTLRRISKTVEPDGTVRYFLSTRKPISTRGMKYNIPNQKGGKHAYNEILVEDQRVPQQRPTKKSLARMNVLETDYVTGSSPFVLHDTTSRAAQLGIRRGGKSKSRGKRR